MILKRINQLAFLTEITSVSCEVGTEFINSQSTQRVVYGLDN
jgi:hypothetical protein